VGAIRRVDEASPALELTLMRRWLKTDRGELRKSRRYRVRFVRIVANLTRYRLDFLNSPFLRRRNIPAELDDELRFHVEMEAEANRARGMSAEEARRAALSQVHLTQTREAVQFARAGWLRRTADAIRQDVLYSVRMLRRSPGFAAMAVLVLALGIGVTTAVFSVVNALFFRPLPVHRPEELVYLYRCPKPATPSSPVTGISNSSTGTTTPHSPA
jgi:hypothetical protein